VDRLRPDLSGRLVADCMEPIFAAYFSGEALFRLANQTGERALFAWSVRRGEARRSCSHWCYRGLGRMAPN